MIVIKTIIIMIYICFQNHNSYHITFILLLVALPRRPGVQSLRDCGSAYLTKLENSRFATVTSQQSLRDCDSTYLTK